MKQKRDRFTEVMDAYGYRYSDGVLVRRGVRGFMSEQRVGGQFRDSMDAAEWLIPIISDDRYQTAVMRPSTQLK